MGAWRGLTRRRGYIWLFIEKSLGTHPHCYLGDAAWRVSGSHIVLTCTWYCLRCIRAFLHCLSIAPRAALHLLTSFACQTPRSVSLKVCVCLCSASLAVLCLGEVQTPGRKFTLMVLVAPTLLCCSQFINQLGCVFKACIVYTSVQCPAWHKQQPFFLSNPLAQVRDECKEF